MGKLLSLAVVIVVVYFMYTQALPWVESRIDDPAGVDSPATGAPGAYGCVESAERAGRSLSTELRRFSRPPIDQDSWSVSYQTIAREIGVAEADCSSCFGESCRSAQSALSEMRGLAGRFDDAARGDVYGWSNPATTQERIDSLLDQARAGL